MMQDFLGNQEGINHFSWKWSESLENPPGELSSVCVDVEGSVEQPGMT